MIVHGPGSPFDLLFESNDDADTGRGLPTAFAEVYRGDWVLPVPGDGVYCYSMFVMSHDGRVSFNVPGHAGGGDVSAFNAHDQWLMGLLRARADAVVVGANTLRVEPEHIWTSEFIFPADAGAFAELRQSEGRQKAPLQVFITRTGDVAEAAEVFRQSGLTSIIITTEAGAEKVKTLALPGVETIVAGIDDVDVRWALGELRHRFGVSTVLCEGGPRVYGALHSARVVDEEFLTMSPVVVGADEGAYRPGLVEGLALAPGSGYRANLGSVRRASDHLFLRTAYE